MPTDKCSAKRDQLVFYATNSEGCESIFHTLVCPYILHAGRILSYVQQRLLLFEGVYERYDSSSTTEKRFYESVLNVYDNRMLCPNNY